MAFKVGSLNHAKGFIINKLFSQHRFGAKHVAVDDLATGYPPQHRDLLGAAIEELEKEGIILIQKKKNSQGLRRSCDSCLGEIERGPRSFEWIQKERFHADCRKRFENLPSCS